MITFEDLAQGKVKLEFGNAEQIEAIRQHQAFLKFQEEENKKKLFEVTLSISGYAIVQVRAKDEEEAKELAQEEACDDYEIEDIEVDSVREVR